MVLKFLNYFNNELAGVWHAFCNSTDMRSKEELIQTIQEFIGPDGYVAFEHGFEPGFNAVGIAYDHVDRRIPLDGKSKSYFKDMTDMQLTAIVIDLMRYQNYCHLYA